MVKSKEAAFAEKVQDMQSMQGELERMRKERSQEIQDSLIRSHQAIADEIMKFITAYGPPRVRSRS